QGSRRVRVAGRAGGAGPCPARGAGGGGAARPGPRPVARGRGTADKGPRRGTTRGEGHSTGGRSRGGGTLAGGQGGQAARGKRPSPRRGGGHRGRPGTGTTGPRTPTQHYHARRLVVGRDGRPQRHVQATGAPVAGRPVPPASARSRQPAGGDCRGGGGLGEGAGQPRPAGGRHSPRGSGRRRVPRHRSTGQN